MAAAKKQVSKKTVKSVTKKVAKKSTKHVSKTATKQAREKAPAAIEPVLLQCVKGMRDILPGEQSYWQQARKVLEYEAEEYGFGRIDVPVIEYENTFSQPIGKSTEMIEREVYAFKTRGRENVVLRPDFTPSIARAYLQHSMNMFTQPIKLFSTGRSYRYDRPAEGRYREFHQANYDIYGEQDPVLDAQVIQIAYRVLQKLGIKNVQFQVNSIGTQESRAQYKDLLTSYFLSKKNKLPSKYRDIIEKDPMRIFDATDEKVLQVCAGAPQAIDHLDKESRDHFKNLLEYLDELDLPYMINPLLNRGMDYYTRTVFEVYAIDEKGLRHALGGGGRYDDLIESLGGEPTPAIGFGFGVDRLVLEMKRLKTKSYKPPQPKVYLAQLGDLAKKKSLKIFAEIENAGILVAESFGRGNLMEQMEQAQKFGVEVTLIIGQKEALDGTAIVKNMHTGTQETVTQENVIEAVKTAMKKHVVVKQVKKSKK
jgi:histidyl-tRNA synthetase